MNFFINLKRIAGAITFGIVFIAIYGIMYLKSDSFFPDPEYFKSYLQVSIFFLFLVLGTWSLTRKDTTIPLFRKSFFTEGLYFLISAFISFFLFYIIALVVKGNAIPSIVLALSGIPWYILFVYAFVVSFPEELEWRWIIPNLLEEGLKKIDPKLKTFLVYLIPTIFFASFHWALGRSWLTLLIYIPLGFIFTYLKRKFGLSSGAGVHFSWDIFIIAFFN